MAENKDTSELPKNGGPHIVTKTFVDEYDSGGIKGDSDEESCGWGPFKPGFCQRFRDPKWVLFWLCWAGAIQGMVVNGFVNVVISNIEKRYDLSSTESGTIASCYDIASVLCLIPVSYFGGLGCKPRYLGIGVLVMGIGSIVFSLPQFTTGRYKIEDTGSQIICDIDANVTSTCDVDNSPASLSNYKYVFYLGQLLHGAGASPLYTLGVTYLDENLPLRSSSFYIGIFYALAIVGPAIGYLAGGAFLNYYVDIDSADLNSVSLTPDNPRWVGAWWVGFLISGALAFLVALPIAGFPKSLPGSDQYKKDREQEVYKGKGKKDNYVVDKQLDNEKESPLNYKQILKSVKVLVMNPTFMFLNLAAACEGNLLSGFATFAPKFIEAQFSLQASTAAQYVGYAAIPAGGGGTFLGGYLVKKFDLHVKGIVRLCLGLTISVLILMLVFLVSCGNNSFAGVNVEYGSTAENSTVNFFGSAEMVSGCNSDCQCSQDVYNPVCGIDGILYYSPCYAGCQTENTGDEKTYSNCSCVVFNRNTTSPAYEAIEGKCESTCNYLPLFMPIFAILMLLTFVASMPALSATLRCVPLQQRSFGLGIQWIIARCLGSIPGPILFGKLIDITCRLWQTKCDEQGSCFFYDNQQMSRNFLAVSIVGKFLSALFFFCALLLYKTPSGEDEGALTEEEKDESPSPPQSKSLNLSHLPCKSDQSIHTAVTMMSDGSTPATTPATPKTEPSWSVL